MDTLIASLPFAGLDELIATLDRLECPLQKVLPDARQVESGQPHAPPESIPRTEALPAFPDYAAPGVTRALGCPCIIVIHARDIEICMCGAGDPPDYWAVTEQDYRNALSLEAEFECLGLAVHPAAHRQDLAP